VLVAGSVRAALALTAVVLARSRDRSARVCALDVAACSGLVLLMAVPVLLGALGHGESPASGEAGLHARVHAVVSGEADHQVLLALVAAARVTTWTMARRRHSLATAPRAAAWVMMAATGLMAAG